MKFFRFIGYVVAFLLIVYTVLIILSTKKYDVVYGISFNQNHATDLGLDWKNVYTEMLQDLQPSYIRIAAMWNEVEPDKGVFNFKNVDFMMNKAAEYNTKVVLVVGQKAPRWPECHVPEWVEQDTKKSEDYLLEYVTQVVNRYKNHAALEIWQVENEAYIPFEFGECEHYNRDIVKDEIALVQGLDPDHKTIITDSGELSTWIKASNAGDLFGTTMYRVVQTPGGFTFNYDWLPAGFYRVKSRLFGRGYDEFFVSELQAEPWFTDSNPWNTPIEDQEKTMNPERLQKHLNYVERVGASRAYLWGVEWWYLMKIHRGDARYWDIVKEKISDTKE